MKKIIITIVFVSLIFCRSAEVSLAAPKGFPWEETVQLMIDNSITPVMVLINNLQARANAIESNITGIFSRLTTVEENISKGELKINNHETRIVSLENMELGPDFNIPVSWTTVASPTNYQISISSSKTILINACSWNGIFLTQQITTRGILHLSDGDIYAIGTCDSIIFRNIVNFPSSGSVIPIDLHLFWQGKLKHTQFNINIP